MGPHGLFEFLREDLEPYPGRLQGTLRDTLSLSIAILVVMTLRIPGSALGVYFILLVQRQHPSLSLRSAAMNLAAICCGVASCLVMIQVTDNDPVARILGLIVVMGVAGFMLVASNQTALTVSFALFWFITLSGFETHQTATRIVENSLWTVAATAISVACGVAVEFLFGPKTPAAELKYEMDVRIEAIQRLFTLYAGQADPKTLETAGHRVLRLSHAGQARMQRLYARAAEHGSRTESLPTGTRIRIPMLADLADLTAAFALAYPAGVDFDARASCKHLAAMCGHLLPDQDPKLDQEPEAGSHKSFSHVSLIGQIDELMHELVSLPADAEPTDMLAPLPVRREPIFAADAFSNPNYVYFGLKTSLSATICYILYNAIGWPGILTAVVTVIITALSTTAAMKQKQIFRLLGAAIGGLLGILSVVFLFPSTDSVTIFLLVTAAVTFLAVWWSRSPHSGYVGYQIALAFYLVALQSFDAPVRLTPARDRIAGVALGLVVMWFVFDQLWPVRTVSAMYADLASMLRQTAELFRLTEGQLSGVKKLRHSIGQTLMRMREMRETARYEIGTTDRDAHIQLSERLFRAGSVVATLFWTHVAALQRSSISEGDGPYHVQIAGGLEHMAIQLSGANSSPSPTEPLNIGTGASEALRNSLLRYQELHTMLPIPGDGATGE